MAGVLIVANVALKEIAIDASRVVEKPGLAAKSESVETGEKEADQ